MSMLYILQAVISLLVLVFIFCYCWYEWTHRGILKMMRSIPTVLPALPLVGHLHYLTHHMVSVNEEDKGATILKGFPDQRSSCLWVGPYPLIVVTRPEDVKTVLNSSKTIEKGFVYSFIQIIYGNGLVAAPAQIWRKSRKQLNHMFLPRSLQFVVPALNENCRQLVKQLSSNVGQGHKDVVPEMNLLGLNSILVVLYGSDVELGLYLDWKIQTMKVISEMSNLLMSRIVYPWFQISFLFRYYYKKSLQDVEDLMDTGPPEIKYAIKTQLEPSRKSNNSDFDDTSLTKDEPTKSFNLAEAFIKLSRIDPNFDEEYRIAETRLLVSFGAETNAVTLSSCLLALGTHPHVQLKLYDEIVNTVGASSSDVSYEDVKKLTYMEKVLKETMRRFAIAPFISRKAEQDLQLSDCTVLANSTVVVSILGVHLNPILYPDPLKFDPERFSDEKSEKRDGHAFLPFGGGPRDCIGKHYAMLLLKIALVHILREYEIYSAMDINKLHYSFCISLNSIEGYKIVLKNRNVKKVNQKL